MTDLILFLILVALIGVNFQLYKLLKLNDFSKEDASVNEMTENANQAKTNVSKAKDRIPHGT
jgi:hypothetical protein